MEAIELKALEFFNSIIDLDNVSMIKALTTIIDYLSKRMSKSGLTLSSLNETLISIFMGLNPLLTTPFQTRTIHKGIEL